MVAVLAMLAPAQAASAATAGLADGTAVYAAGPAEANDLRAVPAFDGAGNLFLELTDAGATITSGDGCASISPATVWCAETSQSPWPLRVFAGDLGDRVQVLPGFLHRPTTLDGGTGADDLLYSSPVGGSPVIDGGPDDDVLRASLNQAGAPTLHGGDGDDRIAMAGAAGGLARGGDGDDRITYCCYSPHIVALALDGGDGDDTYTVADDLGSRAIVPGPGRDTLDHSAEVFGFEWDFGSCPGCVERVLGGAGGDTITGDGERQTVSTGPGDDSIDVHDRSADEVRCGPGEDKVVADRSDRIDDDCETVTRRRSGGAVAARRHRG